jgi:hypothetical protein
MTKKEAIKVVEKHLSRPKYRPKKYRLRVIARASRQEDDWWYICVRPGRGGDIRPYDYYDILAQVEREIEDEENMNIALVPVAAGD